MQVSICCCDVCVSVFGAAVGLECLCSDCQSEVCHSESGACFVEVYIYVPLSLSLFLSISLSREPDRFFTRACTSGKIRLVPSSPCVLPVCV